MNQHTIDEGFREWANEFAEKVGRGDFDSTCADTLIIRRPKFIPGHSHAQSRKIFRQQRERLSYFIVRL